jgi:hypothetical protein
MTTTKRTKRRGKEDGAVVPTRPAGKKESSSRWWEAR